MLYGNLAPDGAIIKQAAASICCLLPARAVVFDDMADLAAHIDRPDLDVDEQDILVLRRIGPKRGSGDARSGADPHPEKACARR